MKRALLALTFLSLGVVLGYFAGRPTSEDQRNAAESQAATLIILKGFRECLRDLATQRAATGRQI